MKRLAPLFRSLDFLLLCSLLLLVAWTFQIKHEAKSAFRRASELEKQIVAEQVEIDLLKSDWSLLTSPARLQGLAEQFSSELDLQQLDAKQLTNAAQLPPMRLNQFAPPKAERQAQRVNPNLNQLINQNRLHLDPNVTGSVSGPEGN